MFPWQATVKSVENGSCLQKDVELHYMHVDVHEWDVDVQDCLLIFAFCVRVAFKRLLEEKHSLQIGCPTFISQMQV